MTYQYEHNLTREIGVLRDLAKGTAEQSDVFYDLRIPIQSGRRFRFIAGRGSDLIPATIPI